MAGSHRDHDARVGLPGPGAVAVAVLGVLAVVAFAWWAVSNLTGGGSPGPTASPKSSTSPSASPTASETPTESSSPSPSPTAPATKVPPRDDLPSIAEESPRRLVIGSSINAGFDRSVTQSGDLLEAGSSSELARLETRGRPGSPGTDTVVIIGEDRFDRSAALNRIGDVKKGDKVELETYNANLTYTIERTLSIEPGKLTSDALFSDKKPGRLLLVATTYDASGNRAPKDTVIVAQLSGAKAS